MTSGEYTIVAGDTCWEISQRYGITLDELYALNPGLSQHIYDLQIGQRIRVRSGADCNDVGAAPVGYQPYAQAMAPSVAQQPQVPQSYSEETKIEGVSGFFHQPGVKIAEGILGAAAAAGLGAFALHEWRKHDKVKNTHAPAFQQYPTQHGTLEWMRVGGPLPSNAIQLGRDTDGTPLYAGRAAFEGGWHVGKIHLNELKIGYGGKEHTIQNGFEVLCGSPHGITVLPQTGAVNLAGLMKQPIDAGHEANGDRLFLAIFDDNGSVQVGKAGTHLMNGGSYCYAGKELSALQYRVVVLA